MSDTPQNASVAPSASTDAPPQPDAPVAPVPAGDAPPAPAPAPFQAPAFLAQVQGWMAGEGKAPAGSDAILSSLKEVHADQVKARQALQDMASRATQMQSGLAHLEGQATALCRLLYALQGKP